MDQNGPNTLPSAISPLLAVRKGRQFANPLLQIISQYMYEGKSDVGDYQCMCFSRYGECNRTCSCALRIVAFSAFSKSDISSFFPGRSLMVIEPQAFSHTAHLSVVNLGSLRHLSKIPCGCFRNSALERIVFPRHGLKSIGSFAFENCRNMVRVDVPSSVSYIGKDAFGATSLRGSLLRVVYFVYTGAKSMFTARFTNQAFGKCPVMVVVTCVNADPEPRYTFMEDLSGNTFSVFFRTMVRRMLLLRLKDPAAYRSMYVSSIARRAQSIRDWKGSEKKRLCRNKEYRIRDSMLHPFELPALPSEIWEYIFDMAFPETAPYFPLAGARTTCLMPVPLYPECLRSWKAHGFNGGPGFHSIMQLSASETDSLFSDIYDHLPQRVSSTQFRKKIAIAQYLFGTFSSAWWHRSVSPGKI